MNRPVESPYLTVAETAEILRCSTKTIRRKLVSPDAVRGPGEFTRVKLDPSEPRSPVRILRAEVDALLPKKRRRAA